MKIIDFKNLSVKDWILFAMIVIVIVFSLYTFIDIHQYKNRTNEIIDLHTSQITEMNNQIILINDDILQQFQSLYENYSNLTKELRENYIDLNEDFKALKEAYEEDSKIFEKLQEVYGK